MKVRCPECGSSGKLNDELAGQVASCSRCGGKFLVREDSTVAGVVKWYYAEGDQKKGPFSEDAFAGLIEGGTVVPETLVWRKGMLSWQALAAVRAEGSWSIPGAGAPARPAKEILAEKVASRGDWSPTLVYAGGGRRFLAKLIDMVFMGAMATLVEALSRKLFPDSFGGGNKIDDVYLVTMFIGMLLGMVYITWFVGKFGATPGKMVFRLKVVTPTGGRVGYGQAFGRYWAEFVVVWMTVMLGYLPIMFDSQKRGLHDRLSNTRVVQI